MELDAITVSVVRTGSVLASVAVEYYIEPNGDAKFYGGKSVIYFSAGEAVRRVTVIAKDDGVPQVINHLALIQLHSPAVLLFRLFVNKFVKNF